MADQWDHQIEADILAGRLDAAGKRADEDLMELLPEKDEDV